MTASISLQTKRPTIDWSNMWRDKMLHDAWKALQGETYFIGNMETDYHQARFLYHTTLFQSLKCILKDGYITGSADEKRRHHATGSMHDGVVCFTTNPLRHLTNLPSFGIMLGWISHDVYFRFPWRVLSEQGAKPVAYKLTLPEMKDMPTHLHSQFLSEEKAKQMYGDDLDSFVYTTWVEENEWRIKTRHFALPPETEIFVSSPQQLRVVRALTSFPVTIDSAIQDFRLALREPKIIRDVRRLQRRLECAADNALRAMTHCEDLARLRNMSKNDDVMISLIRRAERIISKRDKTEAKQWLTDFKAVEYIVTKWEPTPFWREDGFARSQYGKAKQTYVS